MTNDTAIEWPSAVVATILLVVIGAITIAGIYKYPTTSEALEIWSSLTPLIGLITGAFVTYFFTRGAIQTAQTQAREAAARAASLQERADLAQQALVKVVGVVDPSRWDELVGTDPTVQSALGSRPC
jgi:hypothetical protein